MFGGVNGDEDPAGLCRCSIGLPWRRHARSPFCLLQMDQLAYGVIKPKSQPIEVYGSPAPKSGLSSESCELTEVTLAE
jgi:hypothetical protein